MTEIFDIAARAAFETVPPAADYANGAAAQALPFGLHAILITMVCAALAAMVLKRRVPGLPLDACLAVLIAFGTVLASYQTGQREIAIGGFCVIVAIYMLGYFSRVMNSLEEDAQANKTREKTDYDQDCEPSRS